MKKPEQKIRKVDEEIPTWKAFLYVMSGILLIFILAVLFA